MGLVSGAVYLIGCDRAAPPPPPAPDEIPAPLQDQIEQAEATLPPPPPSAWPTEVLALREALERYVDNDTCIASLRGRTPTEVSEGIADLGYDAFFQDVCASMHAIREASVAGCDALSVSSAQRGCRRRLALFHGRPDACPTDRVEPGREPVCIAWALRDEDLCAAASRVDRARCRAVLRRDPELCSRERGGDRGRCEAEIRRYGSALGEQRRQSPAARARRRFEATLVPEDSSSATETVTVDVLQRGVRLTNEGCRTVVQLADPLGPAVIHRPASALSLRFLVPLELELPFEIRFGVVDGTLQVRTAALGSLHSDLRSDGAVHLTAFERQRGGAVAGTFTATMQRGTETVRVRGRFETFVRDLELVDAACRAQ